MSERFAYAAGPTPSRIGSPVGSSGAPSHAPVGSAATGRVSAPPPLAMPRDRIFVFGAGIGGQPCTVIEPDRSDSSG